MSLRRRFIAGAVCPGCGAMDRLVLDDEGDDQQRLCVACGYQDDLASATSREPKTRLDGGLTSTEPGADAVAPVKIVGPGDGGAKG